MKRITNTEDQAITFRNGLTINKQKKTTSAIAATNIVHLSARGVNVE